LPSTTPSVRTAMTAISASPIPCTWPRQFPTNGDCACCAYATTTAEASVANNTSSRWERAKAPDNNERNPLAFISFTIWKILGQRPLRYIPPFVCMRAPSTRDSPRCYPSGAMIEPIHCESAALGSSRRFRSSFHSTRLWRMTAKRLLMRAGNALSDSRRLWNST
jgi:hypothetical protein